MVLRSYNSMCMEIKTTLNLIKNVGMLLLFFCVFSLAASAQALNIAQVVDGEVWQTTVVLTNTTSAPAQASMSFFQETAGNATVPWNLAFLEVSSTQGIALAAGETLLLHTPGVAPNLTVGWGQVTGSVGVVAYAIFTKRPAGLPAQVGTSPAMTSASRILVPFDNTNNNTASMALINTGATPVTISVNIRTTGGTVSQATLSNVPAMGHWAFTFPGQFAATAGQSGLAEFYAAGGSIGALALNFNPAGSLTTAPVYNESGPPIISGSGSAGTITHAGFSVSRINSVGGFPSVTPDLVDIISGQFGSFSPAEWTIDSTAPTFGSCTVLSVSYPTVGKDPSTPDSLLDAGASIPVSGPGLQQGAALAKFAIAKGPVYVLSPPLGTLALGGTYTLTGNGGTQIAPFSTSATLPSAFTVTNWSSLTSIDRASPLTINWEGAGFDLVVITASASTTAGSTTNNVTVTCPVAGNLGTYTIPQAALALLPATASGTLSVAAGMNPGGTVLALASTSQSFTPGLVGGGSVNYGFFEGFLSTVRNPLLIH